MTNVVETDWKMPLSVDKFIYQSNNLNSSYEQPSYPNGYNNQLNNLFDVLQVPWKSDFITFYLYELLFKDVCERFH